MATTTRAGQRGKSIEEVISYAVAHRIRVQTLSLLNEGTYTPDEIARIIGEPLSKVAHHIRELHDGGSIELAKVEKARNADAHFYRAVEMPFYSDEEVWAMTPQQRQVSAGIVLQNMTAEAMAAFWAGKIRDDPRCWLAWRWFNVDEQGRQAIADEQQRSWNRMQDRGGSDQSAQSVRRGGRLHHRRGVGIRTGEDRSHSAAAKSKCLVVGAARLTRRFRSGTFHHSTDIDRPS